MSLDQLADEDQILLGSRSTLVDLATLHPDPVTIFRLWQVYLDNVDPLLKIIHANNMQGLIVKSVSNLYAISPALEASMFGIYSMAIYSLGFEECQAMFDAPRATLLTRYQFGVQQALMNAKYLRSTEPECLTALYHYLVCLLHCPPLHYPSGQR